MLTNELADRAALKELVDAVSILADKKQVHAQVQLFAENAISETYIAGTLFLKVQGREAMEKAFTDLLQQFETVYHFNGQQTLTINGDSATGTAYCLVTLIGNEEDKKMQTTIGAVYQDEFVRENNRWLIAKRTGNFNWQEKREANR